MRFPSLPPWRFVLGVLGWSGGYAKDVRVSSAAKAVGLFSSILTARTMRATAAGSIRLHTSRADISATRATSEVWSALVGGDSRLAQACRYRPPA